MTVAESWARIDCWLAINATDVASSLQAPVSGHGHEDTLPVDLLGSLQAHDGQGGEVAFFEGYSLLSLSELLAVRRNMIVLRSDFQEEYSSMGAEYWSDTWFPFLDDRAGSLLCVDSETGEVICFLHDQPDRPKVVSSLGALFAQIAAAMDAGECIVDTIGVHLRAEGHPLARAIWGD